MLIRLGRVVGIWCVLLVLRGVSPALGADSGDEETFPDRFAATFGYYLIDHKNSTAQLGRDGGVLGTYLDLTRDLDLSTTSHVLRIDSYYRFSHPSRILFTWYDFTREGQRVSNIEIEFGDETFQAGVDLNTTVEMTLWRLSYGYSFFRAQGAEIYASIGLNVYDLSAELSARSLDRSVDEKGVAPLPTFGLGFSYSFAKRFTFAAAYNFFFLDIGDYGGSLADGEAAFEYRAFKNIGVGVGGDVFKFNMDATGNDLYGTVGISWIAAEFFASLHL